MKTGVALLSLFTGVKTREQLNRICEQISHSEARRPVH